MDEKLPTEHYSSFNYLMIERRKSTLETSHYESNLSLSNCVFYLKLFMIKLNILVMT